MKRKLTETEKREKQDLLLEHLNLLSDEEVRKVKKQPPDLTAGEFNRREC